MTSNKEISRMFSLYAELLLLHRKDEKLAGFLSGAAYRIRRMEKELTGMSKAELIKLFRPEVVKKIEVLKKSRSLPALDELIQLTPGGLFEMMKVKGLGGKKLAVLWHKAKIDSVPALLEACKNNMLSGVSGFGKKTQENIVAAIESMNTASTRFHYAAVADQANELVMMLQKFFTTRYISLCGEVRRKATTVSGIEIVAAVDLSILQNKEFRSWLIVQSATEDKLHAHTIDEVPVTIFKTTKSRYYADLFSYTGSKTHVDKIKERVTLSSKYASEEEIYKKAGLPFIVPEMREDLAEWKFKKSIGDLLTADDIKGVVHNHTTWSDGVDTLEDFVDACRKQGYEYTVISDHSKNAHYAGGLKEEKVLLQMKEIDKLNAKLKPFKVFKSIECDIRVSGELDYEPDILKRFDLVIVSVHQLLKMDEEKATKRLIKAIENEYTDILGHMTGRQLLIRPGYPVNFKKVIDACARNGVVIEINANPYRLDMDWSHIPYAIDKGVMISVNPDAHSISEIENIRWGVDAARKGGLIKQMTWNAMDLKEIKTWLKKRKRR